MGRPFIYVKTKEVLRLSPDKTYAIGIIGHMFRLGWWTKKFGKGIFTLKWRKLTGNFYRIRKTENSVSNNVTYDPETFEQYEYTKDFSTKPRQMLFGVNKQFS